jgi:D-alanine-D-alanine ligase
MSPLDVLLICGGGSKEHEISLRSATYIYEQLQHDPSIRLHYLEIGKDGVRRDKEGNYCELRKSGELIKNGSEKIFLNFAIPCIHGYPGETGDIQSLFDMMELPYLGAGPEASKICFNKVSTKLWLDRLDIPNTPWEFLYSDSAEQIQKATKFFHQQGGKLFVKASSQGSSVGCYSVQSEEELAKAIKDSLTLSPYCILEKSLNARELEVAVYEHGGEIIATAPGEILAPSDDFYTYEEKYSDSSSSSTEVKAINVSADEIKIIKDYAIKAFKQLKLKHLARVDFFLDPELGLLLNEINTFPGHTSISMFPTLMENNGLAYKEFISSIIKDSARDNQ